MGVTNAPVFLPVTLTTANHIAALDISDLNNVKRLDDPKEDRTRLLRCWLLMSILI